MDIFNVLTLLGGLALFLYGMTVMGDGLVMLSGGKLEKILERLTENKFRGLLLGTLVTAVIQSSSATTVMVVGFVNSGIMKLTQAVGVIMGANIGTTVTSWILSLAGIESSAWYIKLLKPSSFSPILAAIGIILLMVSKEGSRKKITGNILLGFAVLMFGMETMSSSVAPLKESEAFINLFTAFSNPLLGMAVGAILTAIIQSSSASVGILQALCISGLVSYGSAIPIIMGQNIGTCVTALISSIGAGRNAKRAAFIHLYFNLIGTILFMVVFYTLNSFIHFSFLQNAASAAGIAVIHSAFNISCSIVLFPFSNVLVKLATLTVRDKPEKGELLPASLAALDERFLDRPSFAMSLCGKAAVEMSRIAQDAVALAAEVLKEYSEEKADRVIALEQEADRYEDVLGTYLAKLAGRELDREDSSSLSVLLHTSSDLERMSDHAINIVEAAQRLRAQNIAFTEQGQRELDSLTVAIRDIIQLTMVAFRDRDTDSAEEVEPLEERIDELVMEMKQRHILRLRSGKCSMEAGLLLEDVLTDYERISDHCSNIAVAMLASRAEDWDTHAYLDAKVKGSDPQFLSEYERMKNTYILPQI